MKKIVLISCVSKKLSYPALARKLYVSDLFKKNLAYARSMKPDRIYILSAKHGLLPLTKRIAPYDTTLNKIRDPARRKWGGKVLRQLKARTDLQKDHFVFLAGERYRKYLVPHMWRVSVPMEGLGIGRQLQYLKKHVG